MWPLQDIAAYHLLKLFPLPHASACITIAGKVHQIPVPIDKEMVDEDRLAGCGRGFGQMCFARQHIDEARFANVASTDEGKFGQFSLRTLVHTGTANGIFGRFDNHETPFQLAPVLREAVFLVLELEVIFQAKAEELPEHEVSVEATFFAITFVAVVETRIEIQLSVDEFCNGKVDGVLPFQNVIFEVAHPIYAARP